MAWILWAIVAVVIGVLIGLRPDRRSMYYIFPEAALHWVAGLPLYKPTIDEFMYLPQAAILHVPFALLGKPTGDVVWRWLGLALLTSAIWRLVRRTRTAAVPELFPMVAMLALPASLASAQNGQANLHIAGLMTHAAVDLSLCRWWRTTFLLVLAVGIKPIALVMLLVAAALYPPLRWRVAVGMGLLVGLPFLTQHWSYALSQYQAAFVKMYNSAQPNRNTFTDVHGAIWKLTGWNMPRQYLLGIQLVAAGATLGLSWRATRKFEEPGRAICVLGFAACYLMLFNPRNETNSFVIVAPVVALLAAMMLAVQHRPWAGWSLVGIAVGFSCDGWGKLHYLTDPWFKPALCAIFLGFLSTELFRTSPGNPTSS